MSGIEYIVEDLSDHPECIHGPSLLFSRMTRNGQRSFYACSASRDRKTCSFFLWQHDRPTGKNDKIKRLNDRRKNTSKINHESIHTVLKEVRKQDETDRKYCTECDTFVLPSNETEHEKHELTIGVTDKHLNYPSTFLKPLESEKNEAQFLFSECAITTTINILKKLNLTNVLCIGAPRIHEFIQNECKEMSSLLLDIDKRYHNFYPPNKFCWYNLFNHHFFLHGAKNVYTEFLKKDNRENTVLVTDPPFGGRLEPISQTVKAIDINFQDVNVVTKPLPVLLYFPYFMESHIKNGLNDIKMVDYKVNYDNHPLFSIGSKGRKFGSPVRIFTNLSLKDFDLSHDADYKYCKLCQRHVYNENQHCEKCDGCTSKDGRTYIHCDVCERCVKPTWRHCEQCKKCSQLNHVCGENKEFQQACFHCKQRGHKKNDCPQIECVDAEFTRIKKQKKNVFASKKNKV